MFDIEKKVKELVAGYVPALKAAYKKEMKKIYIIQNINAQISWSDEAFKNRVVFLSEEYDKLDKRIDSLL